MLSAQVTFALELATLTLVYAGLRLMIFRLSRLPREAYEQAIIVKTFTARPWATAGLLVTTLPLLKAGWSAAALEPWIRLYVAYLIAAASAFWTTYSFNWYFGRFHLVDRALVLALGAGTLVHPGFAPLFCAMGLLMARQFLYPLFPGDTRDVNVYCHKVVVVHQLVAVIAFLSVRSVWTLPGSRLFALCLVVHGANYFFSATGKLRLGWLRGNDLRGLVNAGVAHGWFATQGWRLARLVHWVARSNPLLLVGCLALELGGGLLLCHRLAAAVLLLGLALLHVAVLLLSGINFLSWSLIDGALVAIAWVQPENVYGPGPTLAALLILLSGRPLIRPYILAWLDTSLCNAFRFVGVAREGGAVELGPEAFAPFDMIVANGKFRYLCDDPLLVDAWGETESRAIVRTIGRVRCLTDLRDLESSLGERCYRPRGVNAMTDFLTKYLEACPNRSRPGHPVSWLSRDWLSNRRTPYGVDGGRLVAVAAHVTKVLFVNGSFTVLEDRPVLSVGEPPLAVGCAANLPRLPAEGHA
jgi:hypothetical protein